MINKIGKIAISTLLIISMIMPMFALAPASAKNLNLPDGACRIDYYNAGGYVEIALPTPLPANFPPSATGMRTQDSVTLKHLTLNKALTT